MQKEYVIIVAGGKGERMKYDIPKQFIVFNGKPILMHTIEKFKLYNNNIEIILVLPEKQVEYWSDLCKKYEFNTPIKIVFGGKTRFHSVKNGLDTIPKDEKSTIAIHDGVRPLVSKNMIKRCFSVAKEKGNAIPILPMTDSLRRVENGKSQIVNRDLYKTVQTPQVFENQIVLKSYEQEFSTEFTDDASVIEQAGFEVYLTEGEKKNIKITTQEDLDLASFLIELI